MQLSLGMARLKEVGFPPGPEKWESIFQSGKKSRNFEQTGKVSVFHPTV